MQDVKELLERLEPAPVDRGDWDAVMRDSGAGRRRSLARPLAAVAAAAAALFALALFQPWESESPTFLERALAAVDDGPVLHVVLRGEWGGTLVNLETGEREPVYGESETWYDFDRDLIHTMSKLGGVVEHEEVYEPKEPPNYVRALGQDYRTALEQGTARVVEEGVLDGQEVAWITVHGENLPDTDGMHRFAEEVAVSRETYEPVAMRQTRDGKPGPGTLARVRELEVLPAGHGDFSASKEDSLEGKVFMEGREAIELGAAKDALGRTPFWVGREHRDLPLAAAFRTLRKTGTQTRIELEGAAAREAEKCSKLRGEEAGQCLRRIGGRGGLAVGPRGAYRFGPTVWGEEKSGLAIFYGTVGDDPATYRKEDDVPLLDQPHVMITEANEGYPLFRLGLGRYVPPDGSVLLAAGRRLGSLRVDGVYVGIEASSEELILSAARALEPMG